MSRLDRCSRACVLALSLAARCTLPRRRRRGHLRAAHRERPRAREHAADPRQAERRREAAMEHGQAHERASPRLRHREGGRAGRRHRDDLHGPRHRTVHGRTPPRRRRRPAATRMGTSLSRSRSILRRRARALAAAASARVAASRASLLSPRRPRPRLRPALRPADPALVLSGRHGGGGRGLVRHRRAVRARACRARRPIRASTCSPLRWADGSRAEPCARAASSSRLPFSSSRSSPGFAATRIPTGTSRRPWCGSSGGSASPMFRPSSETCGR